MTEHWIVYLHESAPLHIFAPSVRSVTTSTGVKVPAIECRAVVQGPGGALQLELDELGKDGAFTLLLRPEHVLGAIRGSRRNAMGFAA